MQLRIQQECGSWARACLPVPCCSGLLLMRLLQPPCLTRAGVESVGVCMSSSPHLRELRLNGTQLGDAGLLLLVPYLEVGTVQNRQTSRRQASHLLTPPGGASWRPQAAAVRGLASLLLLLLRSEVASCGGATCMPAVASVACPQAAP